jgi:hypothetical protein
MMCSLSLGRTEDAYDNTDVVYSSALYFWQHNQRKSEVENIETDVEGSRAIFRENFVSSYCVGTEKLNMWARDDYIQHNFDIVNSVKKCLKHKYSLLRFFESHRGLLVGEVSARKAATTEEGFFVGEIISVIDFDFLNWKSVGLQRNLQIEIDFAVFLKN